MMQRGSSAHAAAGAESERGERRLGLTGLPLALLPAAVGNPSVVARVVVLPKLPVDVFE